MSKVRTIDQLTVDQLPDLCLRKIFSLIGLRDLVTCRTVCSLFKCYADHVMIRELVVADYKRQCEGPLDAKCWHSTKRSIDFHNSLSRKTLFRYDLLKTVLNQHVRFLCVFLHELAGNCELINGFEQLLHLEIELKAAKPSEHVWRQHRRIPKSAANTLTLENLRIFKFDLFSSFYFDPSHKIYVETPKLETFVYNNPGDLKDKLVFLIGSSIKRVECENPNFDLLAKFTNLEVLKCKSPNLFTQSPDWTSCLANLRELHFDAPGMLCQRNMLSDMLLYKPILRSDVLKIFVHQVELTDRSLPADGEQYSMDIINFQIKNYDLLCSPSFKPTVIRYGQLMKLVPELNEDFFAKFPSLYRVLAFGKTDQREFEWFLSKMGKLLELILRNTSLDQEFMNRLPRIAPVLTCLEVSDCENPVTDFDFILQFDRLKEFKTGQPFKGSLQLAKRAFEELETLRNFEYEDGNENVGIRRIPPNRIPYVKDHCLLEFKESKKRQPAKLCRYETTFSDLQDTYNRRRKKAMISDFKLIIREALYRFSVFPKQV